MRDGRRAALDDGRKKVTCSGNTVEITYDLLQATSGQLERKVAESGARLDDGAAEKLKRDFVRYVEDCELDDLATDDPLPGREERDRWGSGVVKTVVGRA